VYVNVQHILIATVLMVAMMIMMMDTVTAAMEVATEHMVAEVAAALAVVVEGWAMAECLVVVVAVVEVAVVAV